MSTLLKGVAAIAFAAAIGFFAHTRALSQGQEKIWKLSFRSAAMALGDTAVSAVQALEAKPDAKSKAAVDRQLLIEMGHLLGKDEAALSLMAGAPYKDMELLKKQKPQLSIYIGILVGSGAPIYAYLKAAREGTVNDELRARTSGDLKILVAETAKLLQSKELD